MSPDDSPSGQEFGVLIGEVRAMRRQIDDLQRNNSVEHEQNARRMERIEGKIEKGLEKKADRADLDAIENEVKKLTLTDAGTRARDNILKGGFGALIALATLFAIIIGDHIHL